MSEFQESNHATNFSVTRKDQASNFYGHVWSNYNGTRKRCTDFPLADQAAKRVSAGLLCEKSLGAERGTD
ncbi:hypothetical protein TNCV_2655471 [Trichonephila clavipes]|nr:hypothetical protein TNCV_2655471 [Trichonephila clavipes]